MCFYDLDVVSIGKHVNSMGIKAMIMCNKFIYSFSFFNLEYMHGLQNSE